MLPPARGEYSRGVGVTGIFGTACSVGAEAWAAGRRGRSWWSSCRCIVEALKQGDERHRLPGVEPADDAEAVRKYVEATVDKVELSGKRFYYEVYTCGEYRAQHKKAYWDAKNGVIIRDPADQDGGTAFIPTDPNLLGRKYLEFYFPDNWPNRQKLE